MGPFAKSSLMCLVLMRLVRGNRIHLGGSELMITKSTPQQATHIIHRRHADSFALLMHPAKAGGAIFQFLRHK